MQILPMLKRGENVLELTGLCPDLNPWCLKWAIKPAGVNYIKKRISKRSVIVGKNMLSKLSENLYNKKTLYITFPMRF